MNLKLKQNMKTGVELIANERREQLQKHDISVARDVVYNSNGNLSFAASILSSPNPLRIVHGSNNYSCPEGWNQRLWEKMIHKPWKERLIIDGALIAAEIDRIHGLEKLTNKP